MRSFSFDAYEFESPSSEESLDLALSSDRQHATLAEFLVDCGASSQTGDPPPAGWPKWAWVAGSVHQRTGVELPSIEACRVLLLSDAWDDVELAVGSGSVLIGYHWWTTA